MQAESTSINFHILVCTCIHLCNHNSVTVHYGYCCYGEISIGAHFGQTWSLGNTLNDFEQHFDAIVRENDSCEALRGRGSW